MDNKDKYLLLSEGETGLPSDMGVIPANSDSIFSQDYIIKALKNKTDIELLSFNISGNEDTVIQSQFDASIKYLENEYDVILSVISTDAINIQKFGFGNQVDETEMKLAQKQTHYLEVSMFFGDDPLESFHLQLKILHAIVPAASVVIDFMPFRLLSGQWLKMTAESSIPPSPDYLYTVHSVYSEVNSNVYYWLHTHGLHRCGSIELEILNIKQGAQQMYDMLNVAAKMFINGNAPKENEKFTVGYDGLGIQLCWNRWENIIPEIPDNIPGNTSDRNGEENIHAEPSGILFAVEDNHHVSPEIYTKTLSDNPLYFISSSETERMSALAKERFPRFKEIFDSINKKKSWNFLRKKKKGWSFLVKLGLTVDNATKESDREHLWFNVIDIKDDQIYAELVNEPYWVAAIKKGDKKNFPLEVLTDWIIYSPENTYTTDSIYQIK